MALARVYNFLICLTHENKKQQVKEVSYKSQDTYKRLLRISLLGATKMLFGYHILSSLSQIIVCLNKEVSSLP